MGKSDAFKCYNFNWGDKNVYIGMLPSMVCMYGDIHNQNFSRGMLEEDKSLPGLIKAAVHYQEGVVDKNRLAESLNRMHDDFAISVEKVVLIKKIAESCDCYADGFEKKLLANGVESSIIAALDFRRHRPELLDTCECLMSFYDNIEEAYELF